MISGRMIYKKVGDNMPCGGIRPVRVTTENEKCQRCWVCRWKIGEIPVSFCDEWDTFIHDVCINEFLKTVEGEIMLSHGHDVIRRK